MNRPIAQAVLATALCTALLSAAPARSQVQKSAAAAAARPEYFPMPANGGASLPFSEAVKVGNMLYLTGQVGVQPGTLTLAPGGIVPEAHRALDNIKLILERHGSSLAQVVKCTVFLADIKDWPAFNAVYAEYFKAPYPARSALATNGLAIGARTEVECIAFVPSSQR